MQTTLGPMLCKIESAYALRLRLHASERRTDGLCALVQSLEKQVDALKASNLDMEQKLVTGEEEKAALSAQIAVLERRAAPAPDSEEEKRLALQYFSRFVREGQNGAPIAAEPPTGISEKRMFNVVRQLASDGVPEAQYILGECYLNGWWVSRLNANAVQWLRKAAQQSHMEAQYHLGVCYAEGKGVARDLAEGRRWITRAANAGHPEAQRWLASDKDAARMSNVARDGSIRETLKRAAQTSAERYLSGLSRLKGGQPAAADPVRDVLSESYEGAQDQLDRSLEQMTEEQRRQWEKRYMDR